MTEPQRFIPMGGERDWEHIRWMFYGTSGAGKTCLASTFPKPLFLDADLGMASIQTTVDRWPITHWDDLREAHQWLKSSLAAGTCPYETLVMDSVNEVQRMALRHTVDAFPSVKRAYDTLPSMSDYGKAFNDFDRMIRAFRALPLRHQIFLCEVSYRDFEDELIRPNLMGKQTVQQMCGLMDVIGFIEVVDAESSSLTRSLVFDSARVVAKDRTQRLPAQVLDPTWPKLAEYLKESAK